MSQKQPYRITLAGHDFTLRYRPRDRAAVERVAGKNMFECLKQGLIEEHALVLWGGLQHAKEKPGGDLSVDDILDLIGLHNEQGGDFYKDIMRTVTRAVLESGVLGRFPQKTIDAACGEPARANGEAKEAPSAVIPQ